MNSQEMVRTASQSNPAQESSRNPLKFTLQVELPAGSAPVLEHLGSVFEQSPDEFLHSLLVENAWDAVTETLSCMDSEIEFKSIDQWAYHSIELPARIAKINRGIYPEPTALDLEIQKFRLAEYLLIQTHSHVYHVLRAYCLSNAATIAGKSVQWVAGEYDLDWGNGVTEKDFQACREVIESCHQGDPISILMDGPSPALKKAAKEAADKMLHDGFIAAGLIEA